jgi:transcriptional regulator with XRE-family HTH domain
MPTIEQIRAARALLDWSQSDLAEHADLSQTGIARIENGTNKPNSQTLEKICAAFENADIEFLGTNGVRKRTGEVKVLKGQEGFRIFMDDVYETVKAKGGEICLFNGVPEFFIKFLGEDWYKNHSKRMESIKNNFKFKIIIKEGNHSLIAGSFAEYRWFPSILFHEKTFYSYGDKLAFLSFSDDNVVIHVLPQKEFAESFDVLFNIAWDRATKPIK